jgi:PKD repeat protein
MRLKMFLLCSLLLAAGSSFSVPKRVLFIGNSYTGVNDLPNTFYSLCLSLGDTVVVDVNSPGGFTFNGHSTNATTLGKIQQGNWDYVVLQEQSQIPAFSPAQVATDCYPYAKKLCDTIAYYNPCAEVVFYMTWGRKNGDASNCANYPPICTYAGMQQRLRESYLEMADSNNASCAPVGAVWNVFRANFPSTELYNPDESHPSVNGTYLAACTFYSTLFHKSSVGATYLLGGVSAADATTIQTTATQVVMDSLELWQQHGSLPFAKFTHTTNGMNASFSNQSMRFTDTHWDFGDGTFANSINNPNHTYANNGNYTVTLTVYNDTCKEESVSTGVTINGLPTHIEEPTSSSKRVYVTQHLLNVYTPNSDDVLELFGSNGQLVLKQSLSKGESKITLELPAGIYFYSIMDTSSGNVSKGKVVLR